MAWSLFPRNRPTISKTTLDLIAILVLMIAFYAQPLLNPSRMSLGGDAMSLFLPGLEHYRQAVYNGYIPLWNSNTWLGVPFLGAFQASVLYPPQLLSLLFHSGTMALSFSMFLSILWLAYGSYFLGLRALQLERYASLLMAIVMGCSGFVGGHMDHVNQLAAISWIPWIMAEALILLRRPRILDASLLALFMCMQVLAGHPQYVVYSIVYLLGLVGCYSVYFYHRRKADAPPAWLGIVLVVVAVVAGMGMASAQLLPSAEMAELSVRPFDEPERKFSYSFPPKHLLTLVIPDVYGNPATGLHGAFEKEFAYDYNYGEYICYVGIVTLLLALVAVMTLLREFIVRTFSILALLALVIAFGGYAGNGAPYQFIMMWFPGWEGLRVPARFLVFFHLSVSVLAAVGFNQAVYYLSERRRLKASTLAPLCFLVLAIVGLDLNGFSRKQAFRFNETTDVLEDPGEILTYLAVNPGEYRVFRVMHEVPYDLEAKQFEKNKELKKLGAHLQVQRIQPNLHRLWNIQVLRGYEEGLLPPLSYLTFIGQDVPRHLMGRFARNLADGPPDTLLLGLLNVKYVLFDRPFRFPDAQLVPVKDSGYRPNPGTGRTGGEYTRRLQDEFGSYVLFENLDYLPRFVWGKGVREVCQLEALDMLRVSESSLHAEPATTYNGEIAPVPNHPLGRKGMISMEAFKPNWSYRRPHALASKDRPPEDNLWSRVGANQSFTFRRPEGSPNSYLLEKTDNRGGEILLLEAPFSGWVCRIGDERVPMRRVNSAMMGCDLPPEKVKVRFSYEPFSFRVGLFISCCFAMLLSATAFLWRYPRASVRSLKGREGRERPFTDPIQEA